MSDDHNVRMAQQYANQQAMLAQQGSARGAVVRAEEFEAETKRADENKAKLDEALAKVSALQTERDQFAQSNRSLIETIRVMSKVLG
jgi:ABC-type lipoprotein release transport system permease subunit